jgi:cbb3-type cytochrome oxidase maturation protein
VLLVLALIALFGWALHSGQFDDLDREGWRVLEAEGRQTGASSSLPGSNGETSHNLDGGQSTTSDPTHNRVIAARKRRFQ